MGTLVHPQALTGSGHCCPVCLNGDEGGAGYLVPLRPLPGATLGPQALGGFSSPSSSASDLGLRQEPMACTQLAAPQSLDTAASFNTGGVPESLGSSPCLAPT